MKHIFSKSNDSDLQKYELLTKLDLILKEQQAQRSDLHAIGTMTRRVLNLVSYQEQLDKYYDEKNVTGEIESSSVQQ